MSHRFNLFIFLLLFGKLSCPALAHNGHVTVAEPVGRINIDGDLSDWPRQLKSHFIATHQFAINGTPTANSFKGSFRVGCNHEEQAIYIAVEIEDDVIVLDANADEWNSRDGCEIFIVSNHASELALPLQFVYRARPNATFQNQLNPELARAVKVARASNDRHIVYEWRVDLTEVSDVPDDMASGAVFGFDIAYLDRDDNGRYAYYTSSPGTHKHLHANVVADLVIPPVKGKVVQLSGQTAWSDSTVPPATSLKLKSVDNDAIFFQLPISHNGQFMLPLPAGDYELTATRSQPNAISSHSKRIAVSAATTLTKPITFDVAQIQENETRDAGSAGVVYYDLAHGQQPLARLRELGTQLGYSLRSSTEPISLDALGNSRLLYLRAPRSQFSDAEKEAIVHFVEHGGSLLLVMDEQRRTSLEKTEVNDFLSSFDLKLTADTEYLHNCGAIAKKCDIHANELEVPFSGGRAVEGGTPFAFQLDKDGNMSLPFATRWEGPNGGRVIVLSEGMASLFLGTVDGERLSGTPRNYADTTYWGKDSVQFNVDLFNWLLEKRAF